MLYWFRTPPGVKVGRAALDEDAIRLIEQLNPGIEFDWTRILKGQGAPPTEPRPPVDVQAAAPGQPPASASRRLRRRRRPVQPPVSCRRLRPRRRRRRQRRSAEPAEPDRAADPPS